MCVYICIINFVYGLLFLAGMLMTLIYWACYHLVHQFFAFSKCKSPLIVFVVLYVVELCNYVKSFNESLAIPSIVISIRKELQKIIFIKIKKMELDRTHLFFLGEFEIGSNSWKPPRAKVEQRSLAHLKFDMRLSTYICYICSFLGGLA